jgi:hypothetical protein
MPIALSKATASIIIMPQQPGLYGRPDTCEFVPFRIARSAIADLRNMVGMTIKGFPATRVNESYVDPSTVVVEFVRGSNINATAIADAISDMLKAFFPTINTTRLIAA